MLNIISLLQIKCLTINNTTEIYVKYNIFKTRGPCHTTRAVALKTRGTNTPPRTYDVATHHGVIYSFGSRIEQHTHAHSFNFIAYKTRLIDN
jgi:hypothetical protein